VKEGVKILADEYRPDVQVTLGVYLRDRKREEMKGRARRQFRTTKVQVGERRLSDGGVIKIVEERRVVQRVRLG